MTENQLHEIFILQNDYEDKKITFQEFKEKFIVKLVAYSSVQDIVDIVSFLLEN